MVRKPEQYQYSSHRAYLGLEAAGVVDVDPVLRHFGAKKKLARERYREFVAAGMRLGHRDEFYLASEGRILGTDEFVDATIHRLGETPRAARSSNKRGESHEFRPEALIEAVEKVCGIAKEEFCGQGKNSAVVKAKEALILIGRKAGASVKMLSDPAGLSASAVSRRHDAANSQMRDNHEVRKLMQKVERQYWKGTNWESQNATSAKKQED